MSSAKEIGECSTSSNESDEDIVFIEEIEPSDKKRKENFSNKKPIEAESQLKKEKVDNNPSNINAFYQDKYADFGIDFNAGTEQDDDIQELFSTKKPKVNPAKRDKYFDDDYLVDINDVKKRWNIKTLAEPGVNHSKSNYRFRLFGDKEKPHPRTIRPGIYWEENETEKTNTPEKQENDDNFLNNRINEIRNTFQSLKKGFEATYYENLNKLNSLHQEQINSIFETYFIGSYDEVVHRNIANGFYQGALDELNSNYDKNVKQASHTSKNEEDALLALYRSNNYKKGKLNEYTSFDIYQPKSSRGRYFDNGHRRLFCTVNAGKNIMIEDDIYNHFYGNPE